MAHFAEKFLSEIMKAHLTAFEIICLIPVYLFFRFSSSSSWLDLAPGFSISWADGKRSIVSIYLIFSKDFINYSQDFFTCPNWCFATSITAISEQTLFRLFSFPSSHCFSHTIVLHWSLFRATKESVACHQVAFFVDLDKMMEWIVNSFKDALSPVMLLANCYFKTLSLSALPRGIHRQTAPTICLVCWASNMHVRARSFSVLRIDFWSLDRYLCITKVYQSTSVNIPICTVYVSRSLST